MSNTHEAEDVLQQKVNDLKKVLADQEQIRDMVKDADTKFEMERAVRDTKDIIKRNEATIKYIRETR